jgi:hypothetical protein
MDDPDLTGSIAIFEMDCSSAHIRGVNVVTFVAALQVSHSFCKRHDGSEPEGNLRAHYYLRARVR